MGDFEVSSNTEENQAFLSEFINVQSGKTKLVDSVITKDNLINIYLNNLTEVITIPIGHFDLENIDGNNNRANRMYDGRLIDVNYNTHPGNYSNYSTQGLAFYGQELPDNFTFEAMGIHWWSRGYQSSNFRIEGTNDLNTPFQPMVENLSSVGLSGWQIIPMPRDVVFYKFIRVYCLQGVSPTYLVMTEHKYINYQHDGKTLLELSSNVPFKFNQEGILEITNNSKKEVSIEIKYQE